MLRQLLCGAFGSRRIRARLDRFSRCSLFAQRALNAQDSAERCSGADNFATLRALSLVRPERERPWHKPRHIPSAGQFTIQGMPNLSTHMPKPLAQNVLLKGMVTVPPSASALNLRSPSAGSVTVSETEKPWAF